MWQVGLLYVYQSVISVYTISVAFLTHSSIFSGHVYSLPLPGLRCKAFDLEGSRNNCQFLRVLPSHYLIISFLF